MQTHTDITDTHALTQIHTHTHDPGILMIHKRCVPPERSCGWIFDHWCL